MQFDAQLIETLRGARHVAVLTGAGVSAESKIPTFRDAMTGLWARYRPEELATPQAFAANPKLVWDWYQWRRSLVEAAAPNEGHKALARLADLVPRLTLITQNVDSLHQRAGSPEVVELHGNISRTKCAREGRIVASWPDTDQAPPPCPHCGAHLRPDVVWFGESLPPDALHQAADAARRCDVFFSIGTSALVQPAASLIYETMRRGGMTVELNPGETPQSDEVTHSLRGPSGVILPALLHAAWPEA